MKKMTGKKMGWFHRMEFKLAQKKLHGHPSTRMVP